MHIDAKNIPNNSTIEGDICIIGAGAAGISIALDWINAPYKVILLESGGFEYDDKVQDLYKGETTGQKYYPLKASRSLILVAPPDIGQVCVLRLTILILSKETGYLTVVGPYPKKTLIPSMQGPMKN